MGELGRLHQLIIPVFGHNITINLEVVVMTWIVFALLIGNILSSPLRAVRHQLPYYAGIFKPKLALELIIYNQGFRSISLILAALCYFVIVLA